ncbi:hypothetical protein [Loigolactobacillus backii]|uniref:hypothetical protein n=1 Tax=Loigolactobacillus backii TaxID=375175 RepID=UPI000A468715|nr:hypothetical protein [Loigolactobacillus backii]
MREGDAVGTTHDVSWPANCRLGGCGCFFDVTAPASGSTTNSAAASGATSSAAE